MTNEAQRIAIAEACGWKNADHPDVMKHKQGWTMPEKWCMDPKGVLQFNHNRPRQLLTTGKRLKMQSKPP